MPISMSLGPLGCGKTLTLTHRGLRAYGDDKPLFCNYPVAFDHTPMYKPADMIDLPDDCFVMIDEAQVWFPSIMSPKHPAYEAIGVMFLRARRRGWEVEMTTQRFMNVNARVRYICDYIICPYPYPAHRYLNPRYFEIDVHDYHVDELLGTHYIEGASVWDLYDTKGEIYGIEAYMKTVKERLEGRDLGDFYTPRIAAYMKAKVGAT